MWGSDAGFALNKNTEPIYRPSVSRFQGASRIAIGQMLSATFPEPNVKIVHDSAAISRGGASRHRKEITRRVKESSDKGNAVAAQPWVDVER